MSSFQHFQLLLALLLAQVVGFATAQRLRPAENLARELLTLATAASSSSSGSNATAGASTEASKAETHEEGPSTESFTGPLIAGAVAIVLIGAVVAFKHRRSAL